MSIPILPLKANKSATNTTFHDGLFATDSNARFPLAAGEKVVLEDRRPNGVSGITVQGGKPLVYPGVDETMQWEVTFTDRRLICWSPMASGILTGFKLKNGQGTGGYAEYKDIAGVMMAQSNQAGRVRLTVAGVFADIQSGIAFDLATDEVEKYLQQVLEPLKTRSTTSPAVTAAASTTIDNYLRKVVETLPGVVEVSLDMLGAIATVTDDDDRVDEELTDLAGYAEAGITFKN